MLTADTYTSVLPEVAHHAAERVEALVLRAGRLADRARGFYGKYQLIGLSIH